MQVIRFGIIGGGLMGREFASAAARWCHLLEVGFRPEIVAAASRSAESLAWLQGACPGLVQATTDYRELLANPAVDAVYCAVPHDLHASMYCAALAAGKHLLGEKPFGIDQAANQRIMAAVAAHPDRVVRCSSEFPYFPGVQAMARMIREERFGRILEVECGLLHSSDLDPNKPVNWKRTVARNGAYGCMGDLGMHVWHVPLRAGWKPRNVRAILSKVYDQRPDGTGGMRACETWDNAVLLCACQHGGREFPLVARTARIAPGETNTWYLAISGTALSARFSTRNPRQLETLPYEPGKAQAWRCESLGYESAYKTISGRIFEFGFGDAMLQMIAAFCEQVARGPAGVVPFACATPEEAAATHAIFTAALESHRTRQVVEF